MKQRIITFIILLGASVLSAVGLMSLNEPAQDQIEPSVHEVSSQVRSSSFGGSVVSDLIDPVLPDFFLDIGSRYLITMTKEDMYKILSMSELLAPQEVDSIVTYHSLSVTMLGDNYESIKTIEGKGEDFNDAQLRLIRSAPYSADLLFSANYVLKNKKTGYVQVRRSTPHVTIVPEKEAVYANGKDALIEYLKTNSSAETFNIPKDSLQAGKVHFMVTSEGEIRNVRCVSTSGYPMIDKKMVELISTMNGLWAPAENATGARVDQELVLFFGIMGC